MMDELSRSWFHQQCRFKLLSHEGNAFQDFFASVMECAYPRDFQRIRPYGNQGDQKSDGYLRSTQTLFQVYAPRAMKQAKLIAKIRDDFSGARIHWGDRMQRWAFVHNDSSGLPPEAFKVIDGLQDTPGGILTEIWGPGDIEALMPKLSDDDLVRLFGPAPTARSMDEVRFDKLRPVLLNIKRQKAATNAAIQPVSPKKLDANAFSTDVLDLLRMGRRKEALVSACLSTWPDPGFGEELAEGFRRRYAELKTLEWLTADDIFGELQLFAGGMETSSSPAHQAAVLAVLSYFFERCDIFEDYPEETGK